MYFGEVLEVRKPFGFVCRVVDEEGLKIIESHSLEDGQNVVDLGSVIAKVFRVGPKVEFALEEEAPKLLRVCTIEWVRVPKFSLRCCGPIPTSVFHEPFECHEQPTDLCLAICLCIRVGIRYWVSHIGVGLGIRIRIGIGIGVIVTSAVITWILWFFGLFGRFLGNFLNVPSGRIG
jgi:hypothetical protein